MSVKFFHAQNKEGASKVALREAVITLVETVGSELSSFFKTGTRLSESLVNKEGASPEYIANFNQINDKVGQAEGEVIELNQEAHEAHKDISEIKGTNLPQG